MSDHFDLVVIGSGPAGEKGAARAAYFGKKVAIVERARRPGGAAVGNAGIPTKTLRETALYVSGFRKRDVYGVSLELSPEATVARLRARTGDVIRAMTENVRRNIERHGIVLIHGHAKLGPDMAVFVRTDDGAERTLTADAILVASGSRPHHPPGFPFEDPDVYDSETVLEMDRPVASLAVVGRGAVACEYASIFAALGVKVSLVARGDTLVSFLDDEISNLLQESFTRAGIDVRLGSGKIEVARNADGLEVRPERGDPIRPDAVLVAGGRIGNVEDLGLQEAGVQVDERNQILVDETFKTTAAGIYAAGDVIGSPQLASVSMEQGRAAVANALELKAIAGVDAVAPYGVYSIPEASMVGLTEKGAVAEGIDYEVGRGSFATNARANISGWTEGLVKLVFRRDDLRLLGVHIVGENASELVHLGQVVLAREGRIDHFVHATFNVPTQSEAYKYAAYDGLGRAERG
jgi:NAD(P) transhydrogenase